MLVPSEVSRYPQVKKLFLWGSQKFFRYDPKYANVKNSSSKQFLLSLPSG